MPAFDRGFVPSIKKIFPAEGLGFEFRKHF